MRQFEAHLVSTQKRKATLLNNLDGGPEYQYSHGKHVSKPGTPTDLYELSVNASFYKELCDRMQTFLRYAHV
jgi:hypothetical protein